jgi:predicted molibdopterin-dependent oxidoreductase YjgC
MTVVSHKKKKAGRPVQDVKKDVRAAVRFSALEYYLVKQKATRSGLTISSYIRQTAISAKVISRLTTEEVHFVRQLIGMSNNINQIARTCHSQGLFEAMAYFEQYRTQLDEILLKLQS